MKSVNSKNLLVAGLLSVFLVACNSGGSSQVQNTNQSISTTNATQAQLKTASNLKSIASGVATNVPDKGNGVWDYSVATDYYYGMQGNGLAPSLRYDLNQLHNSSISYVFADMGNLIGGSIKGNPVLESANSTCLPINPDGSAPIDYSAFHYYAMPQLSDEVVSGASSKLGSCVNGNDVTNYYKNIVGIKHVIPQIDFSASFLQQIVTLDNNDKGQTATNAYLVGIADLIANTINNDQNTYGVAIDNEPSINEQFPNDPIGESYEVVFFGEIAKQLQTHNKFLFLFAAPASGNALYATYSNIVLLPALYDINPNGTDPNPVPLNTYTDEVNSFVKSQLNSPLSNAPLMFVLPASATDSTWSNLQEYNSQSSHKSPVLPSGQVNQAACDSKEALATGSIDNYILENFLCTANGNCSPQLSNIENFLGSSNCTNYVNSGAQTIDYFQQATKSLETVVPANNASRYFGAILYAWRISEYNDIAGAVGYYNQDSESDLYKLDSLQFPAEVSSNVWSAFDSWTWGNSIVNTKLD